MAPTQNPTTSNAQEGKSESISRAERWITRHIQRHMDCVSISRTSPRTCDSTHSTVYGRSCHDMVRMRIPHAWHYKFSSLDEMSSCWHCRAIAALPLSEKRLFNTARSMCTARWLCALHRVTHKVLLLSNKSSHWLWQPQPCRQCLPCGAPRGSNHMQPQDHSRHPGHRDEIPQRSAVYSILSRPLAWHA